MVSPISMLSFLLSYILLQLTRLYNGFQVLWGFICVTVADVWRKDWRICCPFNLWNGSHHRPAETDYCSISLEEDGLVNAQCGASTEVISSRARKNVISSQPKSQKTRWLSDIYKELGDSSDCKEPRGFADEDSETSDSSSESDYDSDSTTRATLGRNRRVVGQRTSKRGIRILGTSSKRLIRKTRTSVVPSSLGDEENTSRTSEADTLPMVATEEQVKGKGLCEFEGLVPTAIGSGLAQDKHAKYGNLVCKISRNPAEFSTEEAKKYMRGLSKLSWNQRPDLSKLAYKTYKEDSRKCYLN